MSLVRWVAHHPLHSSPPPALRALLLKPDRGLLREGQRHVESLPQSTLQLSHLLLQWGTICNDGLSAAMDPKAAIVMCRQMGLGGGSIDTTGFNNASATGRVWYRRTFPNDQKCLGGWAICRLFPAGNHLSRTLGHPHACSCHALATGTWPIGCLPPELHLAGP